MPGLWGDYAHQAVQVIPVQGDPPAVWKLRKQTELPDTQTEQETVEVASVRKYKTTQSLYSSNHIIQLIS